MPIDPQAESKKGLKAAVESSVAVLQGIYKTAVSLLTRRSISSNESASKEEEPVASSPTLPDDPDKTSASSSPLNLSVFEKQTPKKESEVTQQPASNPTSSRSITPPAFTPSPVTPHFDTTIKLDNNEFAQKINEINAQPNSPRPKK